MLDRDLPATYSYEGFIHNILAKLANVCLFKEAATFGWHISVKLPFPFHFKNCQRSPEMAELLVSYDCQRQIPICYTPKHVTLLLLSSHKLGRDMVTLWAEMI